MVQKSVEIVLGQGLSPEQVVKSVESLRERGQHLDAMIIIRYGELAHPDNNELREAVRNYKDNMIYRSVTNVCESAIRAVVSKTSKPSYQPVA